MTQKLSLIAASVTLALAVGACGSSASTGANAAKPANTASSTAVSARPASSGTPAKAKPISGHTTVQIRNYMYVPANLTVTAGTKVSFHNDDQTAHTATALRGGFDSGTVKAGQTATVTFKKPGTYAYHCLFHAFMTSSITVVAAKA